MVFVKRKGNKGAQQDSSVSPPSVGRNKLETGTSVFPRDNKPEHGD